MSRGVHRPLIRINKFVQVYKGVMYDAVQKILHTVNQPILRALGLYIKYVSLWKVRPEILPCSRRMHARILFGHSDGSNSKFLV